MKHLLRSFAAGLFSAGVIMLAAYYFSEESREELTADEMIPIVEEEGYHVLTSDEYISLAVQPKDKEENTEEKAETKQAEKKEKAENKEKEERKEEEEKNNEKKEDKQPETSSYTLQIKPGMLTPEITELLEENKIIDDAAKFNRYLEEHEYSPKIQIGNFKLTSDMDYYQIAETITDYKRGQ